MKQSQFYGRRAKQFGAVAATGLGVWMWCIFGPSTGWAPETENHVSIAAAAALFTSGAAAVVHLFLALGERALERERESG